MQQNHIFYERKRMKKLALFLTHVKGLRVNWGFLARVPKKSNLRDFVQNTQRFDDDHDMANLFKFAGFF
jgi:hypothetical protein